VFSCDDQKEINYDEFVINPYSFDNAYLSSDCEEVVSSAIHSKFHTTVLDLSQKRLTDIKFIKDYPNLEELDLTENGFESIVALLSLKNLRILNLTCDCHIRDLELLGQLTSLEKLNICAVFSRDDIDYPELGFLVPLINLRELDISSNSNMSRISPLAALPHLELIDISGCFCIEDYESLTSFLSLKTVKILKFDQGKLPALPNVIIQTS
jgi:Leucine-rich repeat (LRR) protein